VGAWIAIMASSSRGAPRTPATATTNRVVAHATRVLRVLVAA
jgi:hypothetical protein